MFLLLEDQTITSVACKDYKSPEKFRGKKVLAASTYLADFDLLRMIFGEKCPSRRLLEIKVPFFAGSAAKMEMKAPRKEKKKL